MTMTTNSEAVSAVLRYWRDKIADMPQGNAGDVAAFDLAIRALTSPPAVPDGFVVVPREPTQEMVAAGRAEFGSYVEDTDSDYRRIFLAMLAAAPPSDAPGEARCGCGAPADYSANDGSLCCNKYGIACKPSPAEQGAREVSWPDVDDVLAQCEGLAYAINNDDGDHLNLSAELLTVIRKARSPRRGIAPLAAGRVGVAVDEAMVERAAKQLFEHDKADGESATYRQMARAALEAALAGPLVAGEVEPVAVAWDVEWQAGPGQRRHKVFTDGKEARDFYEWRGTPCSQPCTIRPLVYADTAKGS